MTFRDFLYWLQGTPLAHFISKSHHLVGAALQVVHIVGFVSLLAAVVLLALRAFGFVLPGVPAERLQREISRFLWGGLALTVVSGTFMFVSAPLLYADRKAFVVKMALLLVAALAQAVLFRVGRSGPTPRWRIYAAATSFSLWFGVGIAGRAIGFL